MRSSRRSSGFSLVELVMMLAIIAILAAIAGPRYANSLALYRSQAAAQRIVADVNLARWQARSSSAGQSIVFSVNTNSYALPGVTGLSGQNGGYALKLATDPYSATLVSASFASSPTLSFDRYGQPSAGGTVTIKSGAYIQNIVVDANTGQAAIQ